MIAVAGHRGRPRRAGWALGVRFARTTSDLFVASRGVTLVVERGRDLGEYLSATSFLGIAGLEMKLGRRRRCAADRLHGRVPVAAAVRSPPVAAVRLVHDPRLAETGCRARACDARRVVVLAIAASISFRS